MVGSHLFTVSVLPGFGFCSVSLLQREALPHRSLCSSLSGLYSFQLYHFVGGLGWWKKEQQKGSVLAFGFILSSV